LVPSLPRLCDSTRLKQRRLSAPSQSKQIKKVLQCQQASKQAAQLGSQRTKRRTSGCVLPKRSTELPHFTHSGEEKEIHSHKQRSDPLREVPDRRQLANRIKKRPPKNKHTDIQRIKRKPVTRSVSESKQTLLAEREGRRERSNRISRPFFSLTRSIDSVISPILSFLRVPLFLRPCVCVIING